MKLTSHELIVIKKRLHISKDITNKTLADALQSIYTHLGLENRQYKEIVQDIKEQFLILEHADNGDYLWYEHDTTSYAFINLT